MVDLDGKAKGYFKYFCLKNIITLRVCNKRWLIKYEQGRRGDHGTKGGQGPDGQKGDKVSAQRKLYHELQPLQSYIFCIAHGTRPAWQSCRKYSTTEFLLNSTQLDPININRHKRSESQETSNCEILNNLSCYVDLGMCFKSLCWVFHFPEKEHETFIWLYVAVVHYLTRFSGKFLTYFTQAELMPLVHCCVFVYIWWWAMVLWESWHMHLFILGRPRATGRQRSTRGRRT